MIVAGKNGFTERDVALNKLLISVRDLNFFDNNGTIERIVDDSNAIEKMEIFGQNKMVYGVLLPIRFQNGLSIHDVCERLGLRFVSGIDSFFAKVEIPEKWVYRKTSHPLWSELVDEKQNVVAEIFYKNTPYDMDAFGILKKK